MNKDARFYFANLGADVARCIKAAQMGDDKRYQNSLNRARVTLAHLRERPEAYEEALLLLRGLDIARDTHDLTRFGAAATKLMTQMMLACRID